MIQILREIEDTLAAGMIPAHERWSSVGSLPSPWGQLASQSLNELRAAGGSLVPTLRRIRELAEFQSGVLLDARARASQASGQALACSMLVPALGLTFYFLLSPVQDHVKSWIFACVLAMLLNGIGALWLLHLSEVARWAGLSGARRSWILCSQIAGERFLALLRIGTPPDLAWSGALDLLRTDSSDLAYAWGYSIWGNTDPHQKHKVAAERAISGAGDSIKKSIQVSLMEGRPCLDRVEAVLQGLRQEIKAIVDQELGFLATRALKPLFVCVAPALFSLLFYGLWLASGDMVGDVFEF